MVAACYGPAPMCGIAGLWGQPPGVDAAAVLPGMLDAMAHRGPNGRGELGFDGGAAGMVRLALVDLSERGQQPMWSADRRVAIVYNGEVYNFRQERDRLAAAGYDFRSTTDTEVLLALYLERGLDFVDRLRGMFAVAILDFRDRPTGAAPVLTLARDPFGIKPLYLHESGSELVFASELKALLASGRVPPRVARTGLVDYLRFGFVVQPRTLVEGVRMLEPGTLEQYREGKPTLTRRFYRLPPARPAEESFEEAAQRLRAELEESVALHSFADAPVGVFLSGGVDSAAMAALMRKHVPRLRSYTLRLPDAPRGDESAEANESAELLDCDNTLVEVTGDDVRDLLPRYARDLDQPSTDGLNTWLISRAAAHDVRGALSGLGGDEWFAGYTVTRRMARSQETALGRVATGAGRAAALAVALSRGPASPRLRSLAARRSPIGEWLHTHSVFDEGTVRRLTGVAAGDPTTTMEGLLSRVRDDWRSETAIGLSSLLDVRAYMGCQLLRDSDAVSMAHSLEVRVPLVDLEVAKVSRTCADEYKLNPGGAGGPDYASSGAKRVLLRALEGVLPPQIRHRKKKGFSLPIEHWMRTSLAPLVTEATCPETARRRGLLDPDAVDALFRLRDDPASGVLYRGLWSLLLLELWCQAVLDPVS